MPLSELPYMKKVLHSVEAFDVKLYEIRLKSVFHRYFGCFVTLIILSLVVFKCFQDLPDYMVLKCFE